jgi:hypothetical protein
MCKLILNEVMKEICQLNSHILLNKPDLKAVKNKTAALLNDSVKFLSPEREAEQTDKLRSVVVTKDCLFKYYLDPPT